MQGNRPEMFKDLSAAEFARWYWLKAELIDFARLLGISGAGGKQLIAARICAALDGEPFVEPVLAPPVRTTQLRAPLGAATVIPPGQRCSQVVRAWFIDQVGPGFHFDAAMRDYFADADGTQTMNDALEYWRASRGAPKQEISSQFEYNRFTRAWHRENPAGSREELLHAWRAYRSKPRDERD